MRLTSQFVVELAAVAGVLAVALALLAWLAPRALASPTAAGLTGLALGAAIHAGFEASGLNAVYCRIGHACRA